MGQFDMGGVSSKFSAEEDSDSLSGFDTSSMPNMSNFGGASRQSSSASKAVDLLSYALCLVLALVGLFLVKAYKRRE